MVRGTQRGYGPRLWTWVRRRGTKLNEQMFSEQNLGTCLLPTDAETFFSFLCAYTYLPLVCIFMHTWLLVYAYKGYKLTLLG